MRVLSAAFLLIPLIPADILSAAEPPSITLVPAREGVPAAVEVAGMPKETLARLQSAKLEARQWPELLRIVIAGGTAEEVSNRLPVAGAYSLLDKGIRFTPQFPFVPGREYRVILHPDYDPTLPGKSKAIESSLTIPRPPPGPRVAITAVYPSGLVLPENTLRFYIHFSGDVVRGDVYRHLKLVRDDGVEVKSPFLELDEELWSTDGKRLTVLFHPGRVKRELVPREEEGAVLEAGRKYTLSISEKWEDSEGRPIVSGYKKAITATPDDNYPVDPAEWALVSPRSNTDQPLVVRLSKPLDHALLGRLVWVADGAGNKVPGTLTVGGGERVLTFTPTRNWLKGEYRLVVDTRLEDVCGNRVGEPFEMEPDQPLTGTIEIKTFERTFKVR